MHVFTFWRVRSIERARWTTVRTQCVACCVASFALAAGLDAATLRADLAQLLAQEKISGLVYTAVEPSSIEVDALGFANLAAERPMRADAKVHVGSIAKTITSLCVLRLATLDAVDLDAPISKYASQPLLTNAWANMAPVTLRHLLDQTAGLRDVRLRHLFSAKNSPDRPLRDSFDEDAALRVLRTEPGTQFSYSNWAHTLAAHVIETVTSERYETWCEREVLATIGMHDSSLSFLSQIGARVDDRLAWGHVDDSSVVASMPVAPRAAAQFTTTAADMAKLMRFLMSDGRTAGRAFIRADFMRGLGVATTTDAARSGLKTGYGLGAFTRDRHGAVGLCHGGSTAGFRAIFCVYRDQQRGFFIAQNIDRENARYDLFERRLIEYLGVNGGVPQISLRGVSPSFEPWHGRYVPSPSRFGSWTLLDRMAGYWSLDLISAKPTLKPAFGESRFIEVTNNGIVRQDDRVQASAVLMRGAAGEYLIGGGYLTLRKMGDLEFYGLCASIVLGLAGVLYWIVVPIHRSARTRTIPTAPAFLALISLALAGLVLATQPWQTIGDKTFASLFLFASTAALPLLLVAQIARSVRQCAIKSPWPRDVVAALCALQCCVLLFAFGLLPTALWML